MFKQALIFVRRSIFGQSANSDQESSIAEDHLKSHASFIGAQKVILAFACAGVLYLGLAANRGTDPEVQEIESVSHVEEMSEASLN